NCLSDHFLLSRRPLRPLWLNIFVCLSEVGSGLGLTGCSKVDSSGRGLTYFFGAQGCVRFRLERKKFVRRCPFPDAVAVLVVVKFGWPRLFFGSSGARDESRRWNMHGRLGPN